MDNDIVIVIIFICCFVTVIVVCPIYKDWFLTGVCPCDCLCPKKKKLMVVINQNPLLTTEDVVVAVPVMPTEGSRDVKYVEEV